MCPDECVCRKNSTLSQTTECVTSHPQDTVNKLPLETEYLVFYLNASCFDPIQLSFSRLRELRALQLHSLKNKSSSCTIMFDQSSFQENHKLELLTVRAPAIYDHKYTAFLPLVKLQELQLSESQEGWNTFQCLVRESLANKTDLRKLRLKSFCALSVSEWDVRNNFSIAQIFGDLTYSYRISELDISNNHLFYIEVDGLREFRHLKKLDISQNSLFSCAPSLDLQSAAVISLLYFTTSLINLDIGYQGSNSHHQPELGEITNDASITNYLDGMRD